MAGPGILRFSITLVCRVAGPNSICSGTAKHASVGLHWTFSESETGNGEGSLYFKGSAGGSDTHPSLSCHAVKYHIHRSVMNIYKFLRWHLVPKEFLHNWQPTISLIQCSDHKMDSNKICILILRSLTLKKDSIWYVINLFQNQWFWSSGFKMKKRPNPLLTKWSQRHGPALSLKQSVCRQHIQWGHLTSKVKGPMADSLDGGCRSLWRHPFTQCFLSSS